MRNYALYSIEIKEIRAYLAVLGPKLAKEEGEFSSTYKKNIAQKNKR